MVGGLLQRLLALLQLVEQHRRGQLVVDTGARARRQPLPQAVFHFRSEQVQGRALLFTRIKHQFIAKQPFGVKRQRQEANDDHKQCQQGNPRFE